MSKRRTTIEKIYNERGFEGTLRWLEEKHGQKLSFKPEERNALLIYLRDINEQLRRAAAKQKRDEGSLARFRAQQETLAQFRAQRAPQSPEEIATAKAHHEAEIAAIVARREAYEREIRERFEAAEEERKTQKAIIAAGYKALAKKHHPDVGGSKDEMQKLDAAYRSLKR